MLGCEPQKASHDEHSGLSAVCSSQPGWVDVCLRVCALPGACQLNTHASKADLSVSPWHEASAHKHSVISHCCCLRWLPCFVRSQYTVLCMHFPCQHTLDGDLHNTCIPASMHRGSTMSISAMSHILIRCTADITHSCCAFTSLQVALES